MDQIGQWLASASGPQSLLLATLLSLAGAVVAAAVVTGVQLLNRRASSNQRHRIPGPRTGETHSEHAPQARASGDS